MIDAVHQYPASPDCILRSYAKYDVLPELLLTSTTTENFFPSLIFTELSSTTVYIPSYVVTPLFCAASVPLSGLASSDRLVYTLTV